MRVDFLGILKLSTQLIETPNSHLVILGLLEVLKSCLDFVGVLKYRLDFLGDLKSHNKILEVLKSQGVVLGFLKVKQKLKESLKYCSDLYIVCRLR